MKKQLQKFFAKKKNNKGFTLIELIIVIAILAILIGIVGMASIRYVEKSRTSADQQTLDSISTAAQAVIVDPANGITFDGTTSAQIKVTNASSGASIVLTGVSSSTDVDYNQEIKDSLAKAPTLKSQTYSKGATCDIVVTKDGNAVKDIKVKDWVASN